MATHVTPPPHEAWKGDIYPKDTDCILLECIDNIEHGFLADIEKREMMRQITEFIDIYSGQSKLNITFDNLWHCYDILDELQKQCHLYLYEELKFMEKCSYFDIYYSELDAIEKVIIPDYWDDSNGEILFPCKVFTELNKGMGKINNPTSDDYVDALKLFFITTNDKAIISIASELIKLPYDRQLILNSVALLAKALFDDYIDPLKNPVEYCNAVCEWTTIKIENYRID
jgi:hypothetical protein